MYPSPPAKNAEELEKLLAEKRGQFLELIGKPLEDKLLLEFLEEQFKDKVFGRLSGLLGHLDARNTALLIDTLKGQNGRTSEAKLGESAGRDRQQREQAHTVPEVTNGAGKGSPGRPRTRAST